jgi:UDP-glucose 4-epimerase
VRILITGGAGFIGTALAKALTSEGHDVRLLDLDSKFSSQEHSKFICYSVDIRKQSEFSLIDSDYFDAIYHLAAQTSGAISQEQPELDADTNFKGTLNVLNFARRAKVKKIIFSSSMAAYGEKKGMIFEDDVLEPVSVYGCTKVAGEVLVRSFSQYNIDFTIFRLFNVYGPGQDMSNLRQGMASIFMAQAIMNDEIKVTGSLDRYRDFVYIDDVVSALLIALDDLSGKTLNVGSGTKLTVANLLEKILKIEERNLKIENIGGHEGDIHGSIANAEYLRSTGWEPQVLIDDGLLAMHQYARKVLK